jgi:sugar lactone lactonase YvrE
MAPSTASGTPEALPAAAPAPLACTRRWLEPEAIADAALPGLVGWRVGCRVGEAPQWDAAEGALWFIDVRAPALLKLRPDTGELLHWALPDVVGALALAEGGRVVIALRHGLALVDPQASTTVPLMDVQQPAHNRLNDGAVSPCGRWFVFGSMDDDAARRRTTGALWCAGRDGSLRVLHAGLAVANGIAFDADGAAGATLTFSDSHAGRIWRGCWQADDGSLHDVRPFADADEAAGRPDGAAVDAQGRYWSAGVSAGCLQVFDRAGRRTQRWSLPCRAPTMPCFGGAALDTLFVTSLVRPGWSDGPGPWDGALLQFPAPGGARGHAGRRWATAATPATTITP